MNNQLKPVSTYVLSYLFWAVSIVVGAWVLLELRDAFLSVISVLTLENAQGNKTELFYASYRVRMADTWSYLVIGILAVVMVVYLEHVYRTSVATGQVWARFSQITALELGLLAVAGITTAIVMAIVASFSWRTLFQPVSILLLAVGLHFLWQKLRKPAGSET